MWSRNTREQRGLTRALKRLVKPPLSCFFLSSSLGLNCVSTFCMNDPTLILSGFPPKRGCKPMMTYAGIYHKTALGLRSFWFGLVWFGLFCFVLVPLGFLFLFSLLLVYEQGCEAREHHVHLKRRQFGDQAHGFWAGHASFWCFHHPQGRQPRRHAWVSRPDVGQITV